ncbi:DUF1330 domain-containing protein [Aliiroseovarius marinus]|uniref:DUF1330 domain-containing protein n=1 Tax=Aliiroseovarius marinus TaxID=2500159 RepID=UPI003D7D9C02
MAKGYWIGRVDVEDLDRYMGYVKANAAAFKEYGARFLVRGGAFETREGQSRSRNVVIEFPSYQAARDCYDSPVYQAAKAIREPVSICDLIIIEGYDA